MLWFFLTISSYLILSVVYLIDKYLLTSSISNPKNYSFYVGILSILVLFLIPFVDFNIPEIPQILLSFVAGGFFLIGLFWFYKGLDLFEASRIVPAIGGLVPVFSFGLVYLFSWGKETLSFSEILAFIFLIFGTILITLKKGKFITLKSFKISILAALFFSLSFVLTKYVYLSQPFWSGFIWIRIGTFLTALSFLVVFGKDVLSLHKHKKSFKTTVIFLLNQVLGASSSVLQNFAIFLAPLSFIALINALQGTQYVFLLIFAVFLSLKFPNILKEEVSKEILLRKIAAIFFIIIGLSLLI